jgi:hypothetical protein
VELLLGDRSFKIGRKFHTFVGHVNPDIDVHGGFWLADRAGLGEPSHKYVYVPAGTAQLGSEGDPGVLHIDTGGGEFDQHNKGLTRTCSTALLAAKLGLSQAPGLQEFLEWVTIFDNDEAYFPSTHIHHIVTALPRHPSCKGSNGETDWDKVRERTYEYLDALYEQEAGRFRARREIIEIASKHPLPNGINVFSYPARFFYSEAVAEKGADVGIQFQDKEAGRFYVGVKVFRGRKIDLTKVAQYLRLGEAMKRGLGLYPDDLAYIGQREPLRGWFLHDSRRLVLCGSAKGPLKQDEYTRLSKEEIEQLVCAALTAD